MYSTRRGLLLYWRSTSTWPQISSCVRAVSIATAFAIADSTSQLRTPDCAAFAAVATSAILGATSVIDVRVDSQPQPSAVTVVMPVASIGISHFAMLTMRWMTLAGTCSDSNQVTAGALADSNSALVAAFLLS